MDEAEALRRERDRARRALDRAEEKARAQADKELRAAEREARKRASEDERRRRDAEREDARRRAEAEKHVAEAERDASQAQREAARAAADAAVAERRARLRVETARRRAERAGLAAPEAVDGLPPGFGPMWRTADVVRRGPRPGLTVAEIVEAGIRLADAEGIGAVSMARVAEAVGVSTMALYRYVGGKDELVAAMFDAATGLPPAGDGQGDGQGDGPAGGWRAALTAWCVAQLDLVRVHPWIGETLPPMAFGPHRLAWLEAGLATLEGTPLDWHERTAVVGRFALHVLGETQTLAAGIRQQQAAAGAAQQAEHPALIDYGTLLERLADADAHPAIAAALAAGAFDDGAEERELGEDMQGFGLRLLLDGVEALIARAGTRTAPG